MTEVTTKTPIGQRKKYFSATTGGLYIQGIGTAPLPEDALEISNEEWIALSRAQSAGQHIIAGTDGQPIPAPMAPASAPKPVAAGPSRKFYSASVRGFFAEEIHGADMPSDTVEITHDEWQGLLMAQSDGKEIVPGPGGKPIAADRVPTTEDKRQEILGQIHQLRMAPAMNDAQRGTMLGKPGAREQLQALDNEIAALTASLPPESAAS